MKTSLALILMLFLAACARPGSGGGGDNSGRPEGPGPRPTPGPISWGDLKCQKTSSCQDLVLNLDRSQLELFFQRHLEQPLEPSVPAEPDADLFLCAKKAQDAWIQTFGLPATDAEVFTVARFLYQFIDTKTCLHVVDLKGELSRYLISTKDYKSETN
jgi:hypothetical protein